MLALCDFHILERCRVGCLFGLISAPAVALPIVTIWMHPVSLPTGRYPPAREERRPHLTRPALCLALCATSTNGNLLGPMLGTPTVGARLELLSGSRGGLRGEATPTRRLE